MSLCTRDLPSQTPREMRSACSNLRHRKRGPVRELMEIAGESSSPHKQRDREADAHLIVFAASTPHIKAGSDIHHTACSIRGVIIHCGCDLWGVQYNWIKGGPVLNGPPFDLLILFGFLCPWQSLSPFYCSYRYHKALVDYRIHVAYIYMIQCYKIHL